jgi:flagellar motor switch protein FliN/FliY
MAHEPNAENARWLMEQWTAALATAIESMTEERPQVEFAPSGAAEAEAAAAAPAPSGIGTLCWEQSYKDVQQPALWITAVESTWMELGARILRAAGIENAEPADSRNTCLEILGQSLAGAAQSLSARLGREVTPEHGAERRQAGAAAYTFTATVGYAGAALPFEVALSAGLMRALDMGAADASAQDPGALVLPDSGAAGTGTPGVLAVSGSPVSHTVSHTMDLLLDVELAVSVSFGRAELPIKEILKLTTGSIVELNRSLSEPVEVIVNNCVVARGEVVVIDGNYGVRIQQIISRQDRLRILR